MVESWHLPLLRVAISKRRISSFPFGPSSPGTTEFPDTNP
jgi:hypothetical protein